MKIVSSSLLQVFCLLICTIFSTCVHAQTKKDASVSVRPQQAEKFTYKIIRSLNGTFGYDIYKRGKWMIHQPSIPSMAGNEGFKSKAAAEKVAQLAIKKMAAGESLPTITTDEIKKLKAI